jgi:hypothetical protein
MSGKMIFKVLKIKYDLINQDTLLRADFRYRYLIET